MAWWQDKLTYGGNPPRVMECGACKDSRITAMYIDEVSNVGIFPKTDWFPWTVVENHPNGDARILGDVKDRTVYDRLPGTGEPLPYTPIGYQQWHTDYPGDSARESPQGLSLMAAAIVAARKAAGTVDGSGGIQ